MRRVPPLLAVLLASACGGNDESATETVTVTTATTVTVTETTTGTTTVTTGTTTAQAGEWDGLQQPLPEDGTLPVDEFNAYAESVDEPWERDLAGVTDEYIGAAAADAQNRSFQATSAGEGRGSATVSLLLDGLLDDSVRSQRYDLTLSRRPDGTWQIDTAQWSQRCQQGRGHQNFSTELCS
jgi:hypothetical protein